MADSIKIIRRLTGTKAAEIAALPDEAPVSQNEICELIGITRQGFLKMRKRGAAPQPAGKVGNQYRWRLGDVKAWIWGSDTPASEVVEGRDTA